jgi:GNAT superfamily N-acetyltransferase
MMEACGSLAVRVEQALAADVAAVVPELVVLAPELGSLAVALGDGRLVLFGPGLFVNHGMALGLERAVTVGDLEVLEDLSEQVGVPAGVEVCPWSHPSLLALATSRGFLPRSFRTVLTRPLAGVHRPLETDGSVAAEPVVGGSDLTRWKEVTVLGFEYRDDRARQGSDLYADAVFAALGSTFFLARLDGQPVGAATLTVQGTTAILGAMSTVPAARRRGVQRAMIRARLMAAAAAGCDLAVSVTAAGGASERNLIRQGFSVAYTNLFMRRSTDASLP